MAQLIRQSLEQDRIRCGAIPVDEEDEEDDEEDVRDSENHEKSRLSLLIMIDRPKGEKKKEVGRVRKGGKFRERHIEKREKRTMQIEEQKEKEREQ